MRVSERPSRDAGDDVNMRFCQRVFYTTVAVFGMIGATLAWSAAESTDNSYGITGIGPYSLSLNDPRVVVLKSACKLYLFDGDTLVRIYPIKLGSQPQGPKRRAGDGRTPEGRFTICTKNMNSPNHRFLGIDYPDRETADLGLRKGIVSSGEAAAIGRAHDLGQCPSWTTPLGGGIGLHGAADIRERTAGCIALANEHVDEIFNVLRIGDELEILP